MATARNDITGDSLASKSSTDAYRKGWETTFGNKAVEPAVETKLSEQTDPSDTENNDLQFSQYIGY